MEHTIYQTQCHKATINTQKGVNEWKEGDFIFAKECGLKNDCGVRTLLYDMIFEDCAPYTRLCKIQGIIRVDSDADLLAERFDNPNEGGNCSNCIAEGRVPYKYTQQERQTFYTLATVVISNESGRWLAFDREGFEYNRYVIFPNDYDTMYAQEITLEKEKADKRKKEQAEREQAERAEKEANFEKEYGFLPTGKKLKTVLALLLKSKGIEAKVYQRKLHHYKDEIIIKCAREDRERAADIIHDTRKYDYPIGTDEQGWTLVKRLFAERFGSYEYFTFE